MAEVIAYHDRERSVRSPSHAAARAAVGYRDDEPAVSLPAKPEGRLRDLDDAEIARLLTGCAESKNPVLEPAVELALNTRLRRQELLGLAWERVDLSADFGLSARITLYRNEVRQARGVSLNQDAVDPLAMIEPDGTRRIGLVFKRGTRKTSWKNALARAGIAGFRFHDLRHTFASHSMMRGGSL
jgi:integrase